MKTRLTPLVFGVLLFFTATSAGWGEPRESAAPSVEEPAGPLTLSVAASLVLMHNPGLAVFSHEMRAREADRLQAGLLPNPDLELDIQDIGGTGNFNAVNQSQSTVGLRQVIELGGKRAARSRRADRSLDLVNWDYETRRIRVLTEVVQAFTGVLSAQRHVKLAGDLAALAERTLGIVKERVAVGKISPVQIINAEAELSRTHLEKLQAQAGLVTARNRLASLWGSTAPRFTRAAGRLETLLPVPPLDQLMARLSHNPVLARWAAELAFRQADVELETTRAVPNVTFFGGYRHFEETDDETWNFTITFPLQFFDRNQGAIQAARHRQLKAEAQKRAVKMRVYKQLALAHGRLTAAHAEVVALKKHVLPAMDKAFKAMNEGFLFGKFGFHEVLASQRRLFDTRVKFVRALNRYHQAAAEVEGLTGEPLAAFKSPAPKPQKGK